METRNEKWESLRLEAQKFVAQEFVATCEENVIYYWKSDLSGNYVAVPDYGYDWEFGDQEAENGNEKNINPSALTYFFTEEAGLYIIENLKLAQGFYSTSKAELHRNPQRCYLCSFPANSTETRPIEKSEVQLGLHTAGTGAAAFSLESKIVKNQS